MLPSSLEEAPSFAGNMRRVSVFMLCHLQKAGSSSSYVAHASCGPTHQVFQTLILRNQRLVKKERRCTGDSAPPPRHHIVHHPRQMRSTVQVFFEASQIQLRGICVTVQIIPLQRVLMLEQRVMHRPELALAGRGLGSLGGLLGEWMLVDEREMPEDEAHLTFQSGTQVLEHRKRTPAVGAFKIAVRNDRDRRRVGADDMIVRSQRFCSSDGGVSLHVEARVCTGHAWSPAVEASM